MDATTETKQGYKKTKLGWIPEEWEVNKFSNIYSFIKTFSFSRSNLTYNKTNDNVKYIHYGDIHTNFFNKILNVKTNINIPYLLDGTIDSGKLISDDFPYLQNGDLIIADASEDYNGICDCTELQNVNNEKIISGLHTFAVRSVNNAVALGFGNYILKNKYIKKEIKRIATGISVYGVSKSNMSKLLIPLPPLPEQQKIAEILSTWDKAIEQSQKLIEKLILRKKGLMQQLLTGSLRLSSDSGKKFNGEWKKYQIGDLASSHSEINRLNKVQEVLSCTKYNGLVRSLEYFGRKVYGDDLSKYKIVPSGYFAYATNHIEEGSIGYQNIIDNGLVSPMYTVFKTNEMIDDSFFFKLLKTDKLIYYYQSNMSGSIARRGGLRWNVFETIIVKIPTLAEQTAIAKVLTTADEEIQTQKSFLAKLQLQKKGLMQQLLTGQKRVNI